jgi:kynurenine 3-monooxygenase
MERFDAERISKLNPIQRLFAEKPFKVTRFEDDNPRVFKSVPIRLPAKDWPHDLNYSARSRDSRITLEALPSDDKGSLCALLLMKPNDELAQSNVEPKKLRSFFDEEFPQFGALISEEEIERVAAKSASALPAFRFAGPRLNMGKRTLVLGDAAHTVKPYFGLGANTALEDVQMLSQALDEAAASSSSDKDAIDDAVPTAIKLFSDRRAPDSAALVTISRNMDRPGKLFFVYFILPLILDGIFHKLAPKIFGPNIFAMFQRKDIGFRQIQKKKRLDRALQVACLGTIFTGMLFSLGATVGVLMRATGKSSRAVSAGMMATAVVGMLLRQAASGKEPTKA